MAEFFSAHIPEVFFIYGLSFFSMGLVIWLEASRSPEIEFSRALRPLGFFGLVHGTHEWFEMYLLVLVEQARPTPPTEMVVLIRIFLLATSFMLLIAYGSRLITGPQKNRLYFGIILTTSLIYLAGLLLVLTSGQTAAVRYSAADVYTRYSLAIPGAALTAWGLILQQRKLTASGLQRYGNNLVFAALAFALYGGIGQSFAAPADILNDAWLTTQSFLRIFEFPVQAFRMLMATFIAIFIIRSLRAIEVMASHQINELREAKVRETQKLQELSAELLHRTVRAQESERQRIARELHDDTGQVLTALSLGLSGLAITIERNPGRAKQQANHLQSLAAAGINDLQRLVSGLHPPQLDDLGLMAALRWYAGNIRSQYGMDVQVVSEGDKIGLPDDMRLTIFRITQEAITNAARHSGASSATVTVQRTDKNMLITVEDHGSGFDADATLARGKAGECWGLMGMIERAALLKGECKIFSQPGKGTRVEIRIPYSKPKIEHEQDQLAVSG